MRILKTLLALIMLLAFLIGAMIFRARPQYQGELELLAVKDSVEVLFDNYGVPHIYAEHPEDAYMALGYVHAQERWFQMDLLRRAGAGRLSEVLGEELLEVDKLFRTLGVGRKAEEEAKRFLQSADEEVKQKTIAYLEGVNTYILEGRLPIEHKLAGIPREELKLADMFCIAGAMSLNFAQALRTDPLMSHIKDDLGSDYLQVFNVHNPENAEQVPVFPDKTEDPLPLIYPSTESQALVKYLELGIPKFYGSNTWVIAPNKTEEGVSLLANDTHIGYAQPCTWYEAHLEYPGTSFYGNYMAGIPFALTGHNEFQAWGVTMLLNDDIDLYCEELSEDGGQYHFMDNWETVRQYTDTIKVKGEKDELLRVGLTHHGPLIEDYLMLSDSQLSVSLQWTFLKKPCDLLQAFHDLNVAKSLDEARAAVGLIAAPGLNISYADKEGNIALWAAAHLVERKAYTDPIYLLDGVQGYDEWEGFTSFDQNPAIENPPWGFVYSCNNEHEVYPNQVRHYGYYEPDDRAKRVVQKLSARSDWSMEAMKQLSMDDHSEKHENLCTDLVNELRSIENQFEELEGDALDMLKEWRGGHHQEEIAPSIYYRWLYHILENAMKDELGEEAFQEFLKTNVIKQSFPEFLCTEVNPWWDMKGTRDQETKSQILLRSYRQTIEKLQSQHGDDLAQWTWGNTHKTTHFHAFKEIDLVGSWLSVGPFGAPGAIETVNNSVFYLSDAPVIQSQYGPQMRRMIDLSDYRNSLSILPTGQSGMRMSPHYDDQAETYIKGGFRPQAMDRKKIERMSTRLLFLSSSSRSSS